jgi:hypothetical protein
MTSNTLCPIVVSATSNAVVMTEASPATVRVSILAIKGIGGEGIITAYSSNRGTNSVYKWYNNNVLVQEGSSSVLSSECTTGDEHYVELHSSHLFAVKATSLVYCLY